MKTKEKRYRMKISFKKFILFGIFIAYIIMFSYTFFTQKVETLPLLQGEIEKKDITEGVITRDEKEVTSVIEGSLYPLVPSGDRVSKGQKVATIESEEAKNIEKNIDELNKNMDNLIVPTIFSNDVKLLENEIDTVLLGLMQEENYISFPKISEYKNKINSKLQKKAHIIGDLSPKGSAENNYSSRLKEYENRIGSLQAELVAPIAGIVVYKLDGYEKMLTPGSVSKYSEADFSSIPKGNLIGTVRENSFKIVDNIECYITVISDSKNALEAQVDQKVRLKFPEISQNVINAKINYLNVLDTGKVIITFRINRDIEKLINYRKIKTEVIWNTVEGMKIPSNAILRSESGNKIYIMIGRNYTIERNVEIVDEWEGYAIIKPAKDSKLRLYDNIILNIRDVNIHKLLLKE